MGGRTALGPSTPAREPYEPTGLSTVQVLYHTPPVFLGKATSTDYLDNIAIILMITF